MQLIKSLAAIALAATVTVAGAAEGLIAVKSPVDAKTTMDRVEAQAKERGLAVLARIDHAAGAAKIGKTPRRARLRGGRQHCQGHGFNCTGSYRALKSKSLRGLRAILPQRPQP